MSVELTERFTTFLYEPSRYRETIKYLTKVELLTVTFRFTGLGRARRQIPGYNATGHEAVVFEQNSSVVIFARK